MFVFNSYLYAAGGQRAKLGVYFIESQLLLQLIQSVKGSGQLCRRLLQLKTQKRLLLRNSYRKSGVYINSRNITKKTHSKRKQMR